MNRVWGEAKKIMSNISACTTVHAKINESSVKERKKEMWKEMYETEV